MAKGFPGRPEHVPVASYHLLRRLDAGPVDPATLFGTDNKYAVHFLTSRKLARLDGSLLAITPSGRAVGEVAEKRGASPIVLVKHPLARRPATPIPVRTRRVGAAGVGKRLSETLLDAADNIDQLSRAHILILIRQAAKVLHLGESEPRELVDAANDDSRQPQTRH